MFYRYVMQILRSYNFYVMKRTFRFAGECVRANLSHIIYSNGSSEARCTHSCTGEILLSVGCTVLVCTTCWVVAKRALRYDMYIYMVVLYFVYSNRKKTV